MTAEPPPLPPRLSPGRDLRLVVWLAALVLAVAARGAAPLVVRGTLPWHNFLSGPTAWNESDYRQYLDGLQARGLNFVGFHCYTGGAERYVTYVEPMIRMPYRDVLPEARLDTSLTARWGYRPLRVADFAFGTSRLFPLPPGAEAFGADCAVTARSNEEHYRQAQALMGRVIEMAHARGLQVAMGFEFGVHPPELASLVPPDSLISGALLPDPTHPANCEILHTALDDILRAYPRVDWIWLWLHEHSMFVATPKLSGRFAEFCEREKVHFADAPSEHDKFTGLWALAYLRQAHAYLAQRSPATRLVLGGWGGGPQLPPVLRGLDRALPPEIVFSCLNPGMGAGRHAPVLGEIARHRPVWSMPWFESDAHLWHLQLRAASMIDQVKAAQAGGLAGVVGIHWRTEEIAPNFEAFALTAVDPEQAPTAEEFYRRHCGERYGAAAAERLGALLLQFEREGQLGRLRSPEYRPYDPQWGRLPAGVAEKLRAALNVIEDVKAQTSPAAPRANLDWLSDVLRFTQLLDEVGRAMEPAYGLRDRLAADPGGKPALETEWQTARRALAAAPVEDLFRTMERRVRSRGELGELSALNQKLWRQYRELEQFLAPDPARALRN